MMRRGRRAPFKRGFKQGVEQVAKSESLPAPVSGLNTRDPTAAMEITYATNLTNFIATPSGATVKEGDRFYATGLPGYVESMAPYTSAVGGSDKLFAWSGTAIYDVTSPGPVGAPVVTSLTNARWSHVNMAGVAGQYLVCANGVDPVRHYNGTSWTTWTTVGSPAAPGEISGVSVATLNRPITHQRRLWFVQENSSRAWYLPINSVGGAAAALDFGPAFPRGGKLIALASWSMDGGDGIRNFLVAISENGDAVIYEGTDPSSATDWTISGTWRLAAPTNEKCLLQFGGDVLYLSVDGLMPLSQYMQDANTAVALSDAIRNTISGIAIAQAGLSGWQLHDVLSKNIILINVPQIDPLANFQFVFNTITKGWSVFTGWPAQCWATLNNQHFFGGFQKVHVAFTGYKNGALFDGSGGSIYTAFAQQAWTYLDDRARTKHATMARINLVSGQQAPNFALAINADFDTTPPSNIGSAVPITQSLWDIALWGSGVWSGGPASYNAWQSVSADGYALSVNVAISVLADTTWVSTDLVYEAGGIL